ncbi:hypothetical protein [Streptomyces sp. 1-11]|uniref:hypothetical protein n=1 Tax=Streptomyces sp. 1-11 TaxID=2590549 RepID=UPI001F47443D|nr:hypothetical protein [Streptomyces sp. 1-11]
MATMMWVDQYGRSIQLLSAKDLTKTCSINVTGQEESWPPIYLHLQDNRHAIGRDFRTNFASSARAVPDITKCRVNHLDTNSIERKLISVSIAYSYANLANASVCEGREEGK